MHLHDFDQDIYGARLRVHLVERIRPEMKFPSVEELVSRIFADIETARRTTAREASIWAKAAGDSCLAGLDAELELLLS